MQASLHIESIDLTIDAFYISCLDGKLGTRSCLDIGWQLQVWRIQYTSLGVSGNCDPPIFVSAGIQIELHVRLGYQAYAYRRRAVTLTLR